MQVHRVAFEWNKDGLRPERGLLNLGERDLHRCYD